MTKQEEETIRNLIARLKEPSLGGADGPMHTGGPKTPKPPEGYELVSRIYVDTWLLGALECLLPGEGRDPALAVRMSRK